MAVVASIAANPPSVDPSEQYKTRMRLRIKTKSPADNTTATAGALCGAIAIYHSRCSYGTRKMLYATQEWCPRLVTKRSACTALDSHRKLVDSLGLY